MGWLPTQLFGQFVADRPIFNFRQPDQVGAWSNAVDHFGDFA